MDPMKFIEETLNSQNNCDHKSMCVVWPRRGNPRWVCNICRFARELTAEEIKQQEKRNGM